MQSIVLDTNFKVDKLSSTKPQSFPKEINENRKCFPLDSFSILVCFERLCSKNSRCLRLFSYQESVAFGMTDELGCIQALNGADTAGI